MAESSTNIRYRKTNFWKKGIPCWSSNTSKVSPGVIILTKRNYRSGMLSMVNAKPTQGDRLLKEVIYFMYLISLRFFLTGNA